MLIPSYFESHDGRNPSLSRRVNANSQLFTLKKHIRFKLIKKGEC